MGIGTEFGLGKKNPKMECSFDIEAFRKDVITERAVEARISQTELAKQLGLSKATISRIEDGKLPDINTFCKICNWLKKDPRRYIRVYTGVRKA